VNNNEKWFWKMNWCKEQGVAPANSYWWEEAEKALEEFKALETQNNGG